MLSSLTQLKTFLLPPAMATRTDFDAMLTMLGTGVTALMESYCNRKFSRVVGDTYSAGARNVCYSLPRYPLEVVSSVSLQTDVVTDITDTIVRTELLPGLVHFISPCGFDTDTIVFTFTGGWWWDTSEDQSGTMPSGAFALPTDIQMAFFLQMKAVCEAQDVFGLRAAGGEDKAKPSTSMMLELIPAVITILNLYRRMFS